MPRGIYDHRKRRKAAPARQRVERIAEREPQRVMQEPEPSTRLSQIKQALAEIGFGFTIFFTDERGKSIKYYCGSVVQEDAV